MSRAFTQTLGLSDSTPKPSFGRRGLFRPDLTTPLPNVHSACHSEAIAWYVIATFTAIAAFFNSWVARIAALLGFLIGLLKFVNSIAHGVFPGVPSLFIIVILLNGARASFAYHRLNQSESVPPPPPVVAQ